MTIAEEGALAERPAVRGATYCMAMSDIQDGPGVFEVVPNNGTSDLELLNRYWSAHLDDSGRLSFDEKVQAIADDFEIKAHKVSERARLAGHARRLGVDCPNCGELWTCSVRSDASPGARYVWSRCLLCVERQEAKSAEVKEAAAAAAALERSLAEARAARLQEAFPVSDLSGPAFADVPYSASAWDLSQLLSLNVWLRATGPAGILVPIHEIERTLFADDSYDRTRDLWNAELLAIHPSSDLNAFEWTDDLTELPRFYTHRARFNLKGSGSLFERVEDALDTFQTLLQGPWPNSWLEQALMVTREVIVAEAIRYFTHQLGRHGLPGPTGDALSELRTCLSDATEAYSLGQFYYLCWSATKDGAAITRRYPVGDAKAVVHAVNQFASKVERSRADGWDVKSYRDVRTLPLAAYTVDLFQGLFGLDPMEASLDEVGALARQLLDDEDTTRRLLAEGFPVSRASQAFSMLLALPSYPDGSTDVVEAIQSAARAVVAAGGSEGDALRTAFYSLDVLRTLGCTAEWEIENCEFAILTAIDGRDRVPRVSTISDF